MSTKEWVIRNKDKVRGYRQKHYAANRKKVIAKSAVRTKFLRNVIYSYKIGKHCVQCGESDVRCLQFHHKIPGTKEFGIGHFGCGVGIKRLMAEINKCELLCANCHCKLHF